MKLKNFNENFWRKIGLGLIYRNFQLLNTINSCIFCFTRMAPNKTCIKKHELILIFLSNSKKKYKPKYEERNLVRIAEPDDKFRKGSKLYREVFTVFKVITLSPPIYNSTDADNIIINYQPELFQVNAFVSTTKLED